MTTTGAEAVRWDLSELYQSLDDPAIPAALQKIEQDVDQFVGRYKNHISELSSEALSTAFQQLAALLENAYKLEQYASLRYAVDTSDEQLKAFEAKINELTAKASNKLVFFDLELGRLTPAQMDRHRQAGCLSAYHYYLKRKFETAKYDLSEKEEQLGTLKDLTGSQAFYTLYEELVSSFRFEFELDGVKQTLNGDELRALRQHPDQEVRRRAMKDFLNRYQEHRIVISNCYNNIVKSYNIERELRGYPNAITQRNVGNDLNDQAVAALHEATVASYPLVHRYYDLKKKIMNLSDMTLADIYAPMPASSKSYSWDEAQSLVLTAFARFDNDFHQKARLMLDQQRIDAPVEPAKRGGAFCSSSIPGLNPYVLLNFTGKLRDVSTLAHELGHAIHAMFSSRQTIFNYHAILPLAETASLFSEMVLTDHLLKHESDPQVKISLLTNKLEEIFASSHRQNMFSCFEMATHDKIHRNLLSADELCRLYREELEKMFGQSVIITEEYQWEWAAIPHIFAYPFYVYAYNFANLLVLALYQHFLEQGTDFIPKFKQMLALGSSTDPVTITALAGADIRHQSFWEKSLKVIERYIDELEELI